MKEGVPLTEEERQKLDVAFRNFLLTFHMAPMGDPQEARRLLTEQKGRPVTDPEVAIRSQLEYPNLYGLNEKQVGKLRKDLDVYEAGGTPFRFLPKEQKLEIMQANLTQARQWWPNDEKGAVADLEAQIEAAKKQEW